MHYEIVRRLGRGGMGVVDLARGPDGREVALKRLSLHGTPEELETARARIRREAEVLQRLHHPNIVELEEVLDDGDDIVLVMAYLPGGNLAQRVTEHGPLAPDEVARLGDQLLDALATAHRQGVVHRDIKPANVLFAADGTPALADFGVAVHRDATPGLTATEMVVGTPGFMAPEQARGDEVTAASDVFSLGATLQFAATGSGPWGHGDPRVLMLRAVSGRAERLPRDLPDPLRRQLATMLARDPADRPTAAALRGGPAGTLVRPGAAAGATRRRRAAAIASVVVAAVAVAAALAVVLRSSDGDRRDDAAAGATTTSETTTTTEACEDKPYQPCGSEPAPNTDGERCLDDTADYDDDALNGCEAVPDDLGDDTFLDGELQANLVPVDDVDTYRLEVEDRFQLSCDGQVHVTLTAPAGTSQRVRVLDGDVELASAVSGDGVPGTATVREANCFTSDSTTLTVVVESVGTDRSPEDYVLTATGSF
ncbi:MAG: serine/threonine protein kinase [Acidimicrobiales bacterium]|nr:serine/threonine protein kinase [Acidimicrobiales bacterium]